MFVLPTYHHLCTELSFLLQAIFMIPTNPPPTFRNPDLWSADFQDFVSQCLVKNPENRATATQLLQVTLCKMLLLILVLESIMCCLCIIHNMQFEDCRHKKMRPLLLINKKSTFLVKPSSQCLVLFPSASIYQVGQAQFHPQSPDHRRHGDQNEETGGRTARARRR